MLEVRKFAFDTYLAYSTPWHLYVGGRALCADGKVRTLKRISETSDTYFSTPAAVQIRGRTVSGYVTVETAQGLSTATSSDPAVLKFFAVKYGRNYNLLPTPDRYTP
jgi:hypothetical protein